MVGHRLERCHWPADRPTGRPTDRPPPPPPRSTHFPFPRSDRNSVRPGARNRRRRKKMDRKKNNPVTDLGSKVCGSPADARLTVVESKLGRALGHHQTPAAEREREKPRWLTPPGGRRPKRWWRSAGVSDWRQGRHPRTTEIPSCILLFGSRWRCGLLHLLLLLLYDFDFDFGFVSPWLPHSGRRPAPPSAIGSQPRFLRPPNECGRVPPNQEN